MGEYQTIIDQQEKLLQLLTSPKMMITQKTLRDEFAMAALTGILAKHDNILPETVAEIAFSYADYMMEARK